jgi:catechol 2,3-dioxygenase-like lactoylglutathione lyase family enzyme
MLSNSRVTASLPFDGLKAAREFYSKKLGLKLLSGSVNDGYLEFAAGKGTTIQVFESDSKKSNDTAVTFEVANLARAMAALRKKRVVFEEYNLPGIRTVRGVASMGDHRAAWFKDPGGNILCLHQRA